MESMISSANQSYSIHEPVYRLDLVPVTDSKSPIAVPLQGVIACHQQCSDSG